jgi:hypothetical protein
MGQDIAPVHDSLFSKESNEDKGEEMVDNVNIEKRDPLQLPERPANKLNAVFENPLADIPREQLLADVARFCKQYGLEEYEEVFKKGALVSQNPAGAQDLVELSEEEKTVLRREHTHKWSHPWQLYFLASKCGICGMQSSGFC